MGSALTAGASLASTGMQIADKNVDRAFQASQQAYQNKWQSNENQKDRLWQQQEWTRQFEAQNAESDKRFQMENDEWQRRFDAQNKYNDPSAVVQRLQAAGINPAAAIGQLSGSGGLAAAGGSSAPSMPNVMGTQMPSPHGVTPVGVGSFQPINVSGIMTAAADLMNARSKAKEVGLKEEYQAATLDAELRQKLAAAGKDEALAAYTKFQQTVDEVWKDKEIDANIKKTLSEADANIARAFALEEQGKSEEARRLYDQAMAAFVNTKDKALQKYIPYLSRHANAIITNLQTGSQRNVADANLSDEQAATTKALRPWQVKIQQYEAGIKSTINRLEQLEFNLASETQKDRIAAQVEEYQRAGLVTKELAEKVKLAAKDNDSYTLRLWQNLLKDMVSGGTEVYNAKTGRKRLSTGRNISTSSKKIGDNETFTETRIEPYNLDDLY